MADGSARITDDHRRAELTAIVAQLQQVIREAEASLVDAQCMLDGIPGDPAAGSVLDIDGVRAAAVGLDALVDVPSGVDLSTGTVIGVDDDMPLDVWADYEACAAAGLFDPIKPPRDRRRHASDPHTIEAQREDVSHG